MNNKGLIYDQHTVYINAKKRKALNCSVDIVKKRNQKGYFVWWWKKTRKSGCWVLEKNVSDTRVLEIITMIILQDD